MRWGVRKDRVTGKRVGTPAKGTKRARHDTPSVSPKTSSSSPPSAKSVSSTATRDLTNQQLQEVVTRIRLESEFKKLTAPKTAPSFKQKVGQASLDILARVGKRQAEYVLNSAVQSQVDKWLKEQGLMPAKKKKK